jgi:hypothetical protein
VRASTEGPRVLGTLVGTASALALIDEPADFTIRRYAPGDLFPDGATQVLQIQVDAVVLGRREGCTLLIPGESGRGRSVACPAPPAHDPPETSSERRR